MMLPLEIMAGFAAGMGLARAAEDPLSRTYDPLRTRYFAVVVLFAAGALIPAGLVLYAQYPEWSLMYAVNSAHVPPIAVVPLLSVLLLLAPAAGFGLAHRLILARNENGRRLVRLGMGGVALFLVVAGLPRWLVVAHYDDFHHGGRVIPLYATPLLWLLLLVVFFAGFAYVFCILAVRRHVLLFSIVDPTVGVETR